MEIETRLASVIDRDNLYVDIVLVNIIPDLEGDGTHEEPYQYTMTEGEQLIYIQHPDIRANASTDGFLRPKWDGAEGWVEAATVEEIAAWEAEHPAPPPLEANPIEEIQTKNRLIEAKLVATTDRQDFLEDCIAEMAAQVYSV